MRFSNEAKMVLVIFLMIELIMTPFLIPLKDSPYVEEKRVYKEDGTFYIQRTDHSERGVIELVKVYGLIAFITALLVSVVEMGSRMDDNQKRG